MLTERLAALADAGVLRREQYKEPGSRTRTRYHLIQAGAELQVVIAALQQWGDAHLPVSCGPTIERRDHRTGQPVDVAFVNANGRRIDLNEAEFIRTPAYPA